VSCSTVALWKMHARTVQHSCSRTHNAAGCVGPRVQQVSWLLLQLPTLCRGPDGLLKNVRAELSAGYSFFIGVWVGWGGVGRRGVWGHCRAHFRHAVFWHALLSSLVVAGSQQPWLVACEIELLCSMAAPLRAVSGPFGCACAYGSLCMHELGQRHIQ
jgi:hypothetical protein